MLNISIWPIDKTQSGATTSGQSGPGSSGNEGVLYILQISKTGALQSDCLASYPGHLLVGVSVFYNPSWLGWRINIEFFVYKYLL